MKEITLTKEKLLEIIKQAFIHGQGNKEMMQSGLERDEIEDYTRSVINKLFQKK